MVEGFTLDRAHGGAAVSSWIEGAPERSVWTGVRLGGRAQSTIATWRCGRCGFLESYASGEPDRSLAAQRKTAGLIVVAVAAAAALLLGLVAAYLAQRGP
jgi:hypothetical protein